MIITDFVPQKRKLRVNVFVDGQYAFGISQELRFEKKLEIGNPITQSEIESLIESDQISRLLNKVLNFLSFRPRSEKEIYDHFLKKAEFRDDLGEEERLKIRTSLDKVIEKLRGYGQLNDLEFVQWWVGQRNRFKPRGERLLRLELKQKGVPEEIIDDYFAKNTSSPQETLESALSIVQKKLSIFQKLPPLERKKKISDLLARRGYGWDIIKQVLETLKKSS